MVLRKSAQSAQLAYQNLMLAQEQIDSFDYGLKEASEEGVYLAWQQFNWAEAAR